MFKTFPDINTALSSIAQKPISLEDCHKQALSGGCISSAWLVESPHFGRLVYKENYHAPHNFFLAEAQGLSCLSASAPAGLYVPRVMAVMPCGILMEHLCTAVSGKSISEAFGRALALLHRDSAEKASMDGNPLCYGFEHDNYLGLSAQLNKPSDNWQLFFAEQRLGHQLEIAAKQGIIPSAIGRRIEQLIERTGEIIPKNPPPSLLHGDLWGGNYMTTSKNNARVVALIDPAVYNGHSEADLAMTELFGGFEDSFYRGYRELIPLSRGYEQRKELYNLYHLLNHLNLFGSAYVASIVASLRKIGV